jgi:hypothetical protein
MKAAFSWFSLLIFLLFLAGCEAAQQTTTSSSATTTTSTASTTASTTSTVYIPSAHQINLAVEACTYVNSDAPNGNYSNPSGVYMGCIDTTIYYAFLRFDIIPIPLGALINSAIFYYYVNSGSTTAFHIANIASTWEESAITWNNVPSLSSLIASGQAGGTYGYNSIDITNGFRQWYNGTTPNYGFRMHGEWEGGYKYMIFGGRSSVNPPYIKVNYTY